jgi:L-iditol 2-dehydrogenase
MKALVINKPGELQVTDLPTPAIGADGVLVRMRAVGICHSDYELYSGKYIIPIDYPVIPGHEWSGEVESRPARPSAASSPETLWSASA